MLVMYLIEQLRQLHAQAGQLVDVEEASIIDVVRGDAEVRRTPVLILDQYIQPPPGLEAPRLAVDPVNRRLHRLVHITALPCEKAELGLQVLGAPAGAAPAGPKTRHPIALVPDAHRRARAGSVAG